MTKNEILRTAEGFEALTASLLDLKEQKLSEIAPLLADGISAAVAYKNEELIPKELCRLLLSLDEYLCFASFVEQGELLDFHCYQAVSNIASAIKKGLFEGGFECIFDVGAPEDYNLSPDRKSILSYLESVKNRTSPRHNGIRIEI